MQLFSFKHPVDSICIRNNFVVVTYSIPNNLRQILVEQLELEVKNNAEEYVIKDIQYDIKAGDIHGEFFDAVVHVYDLDDDGTLIFEFDQDGTQFITAEIQKDTLFLLTHFKLFRMNIFGDQYDEQLFHACHHDDYVVAFPFVCTNESICIGFNNGEWEETEIFSPNVHTESNPRFVNVHGTMVELLLWYAFSGNRLTGEEYYGLIHVFSKGIIKTVETFVEEDDCGDTETLCDIGTLIVSATVSSNSHNIIISCADGTLKCFVIRTWTMLWSIPHIPFDKLYCAPTDQYIIGISHNTMYVISMDGKAGTRIDAHQDKITSIAFASNGLILSGSTDKTIRGWNCDSDSHVLIECMDLQPQDVIVKV